MSARRYSFALSPSSSALAAIYAVIKSFTLRCAILFVNVHATIFAASYDRASRRATIRPPPRCHAISDYADIIFRAALIAS